jgi:drug/metabolite transporter (DMT)-like permease
MANSHAPPAGSALRTGTALFVCSVLSFAGLDTIAKYLTADYHVMQITWGRYVFHAAFLVLLMPRHGILRPMRSARPIFQLVRATLLVVVTWMFFTSIFYLPLAEATAIAFTTPLFVTGLAHLLRQDQVGVRRWSAVLAGFVGVLVIIRPGLGVMHWAAFIVLLMALLNALYHLATRMLTGVDPTQTTIFYTGIVGALAMSAIVPFFWRAPDALGWALLVSVGFFGGLGHYLLIRAYEYALPSTLAPYSYTQIVWITGLGYAVFGDFPDAFTLAGTAIIVASGVYVFYRETVLRRRRDKGAS